MNEEVRELRKKYHISYDEIGDYIGYSGGYIKYLLGHELTDEKRELIVNAINALKGENIKNVKPGNINR